MNWSADFIYGTYLVISDDYRFRILAQHRFADRFRLEKRSGMGGEWVFHANYTTLEAAKSAAEAI